MRWAIEEGGYARIEWKANALNEPSRRAALRLGFVFEGVFRKHMVIKGRRRDRYVFLFFPKRGFISNLLACLLWCPSFGLRTNHADMF